MSLSFWKLSSAIKNVSVRGCLMRLRKIMIGALASMCLSAPAYAHSGWSYPVVRQDVQANDGPPPKMKGPDPSWEKVSDLQDSDGTVNVASCSDPTIVALVRSDIVDALNSEGPQLSNPAVTKADVDEVWVHQTVSSREVCTMKVKLEGPISVATGTDQYAFQTYTNDGSAKLFFENKSDPD